MIYRHQHSHVSPNLAKEFPNRPIHPSSRLNNSPSENNISVLGIILRRHKEKPLGLNFPLQPQLWIIRQTRKQNVDELKRRKRYKKSPDFTNTQYCSRFAQILHGFCTAAAAQSQTAAAQNIATIIILSGIASFCCLESCCQARHCAWLWNIGSNIPSSHADCFWINSLLKVSQINLPLIISFYNPQVVFPTLAACPLELQTKVREDFTIMEKARHLAKQALKHLCLLWKLCQRLVALVSTSHWRWITA